MEQNVHWSTRANGGGTRCGCRLTLCASEHLGDEMRNIPEASEPLCAPAVTLTLRGMSEVSFSAASANIGDVSLLENRRFCWAELIFFFFFHVSDNLKNVVDGWPSALTTSPLQKVVNILINSIQTHGTSTESFWFDFCLFNRIEHYIFFSVQELNVLTNSFWNGPSWAETEHDRERSSGDRRTDVTLFSVHVISGAAVFNKTVLWFELV